MKFSDIKYEFESILKKRKTEKIYNMCINAEY